MTKRVQAGKGGVRVVDGGSTLVECVGPFFVQDGPTDNDRVRFKPGDRALVTTELSEHLAKGNAAVVIAQPKPKPKRKGKAKEDKAERPTEDK